MTGREVCVDTVLRVGGRDPHSLEGAEYRGKTHLKAVSSLSVSFASPLFSLPPLSAFFVVNTMQEAEMAALEV